MIVLPAIMTKLLKVSPILAYSSEAAQGAMRCPYDSERLDLPRDQAPPASKGANPARFLEIPC
jgi:hypothetical protein